MSSSESVEPADTTGVGARGTRGRLPYRWRIVGANYLVVSLNYVDRTAIAVVTPLLLTDLGLTKAQLGWALTAFFVGYIPTCLAGGHWADRAGPRKVMAAAITVWSVFVGLTSAAFSLASLIVIRVLFGAGEGPQTAASTKTVSNWFPRRRMSTAVGVTLSAQPIGGAIGAPLTVLIVGLAGGNWRAPFVVFGVLGLLFAVGWWLAVRDRPDQHPKVSAAEIAEMAEDERAQAAEQRTAADARVPLRRFLTNRLVLVTVLANFGTTWLFYTFANWFPLFLSEAHGLDLAQTAFGTALPWIAGTIGMLLSGIVADAYARRSRASLFATRKRVFVAAVAVASVLVCFVATAHTTLLAAGLMTVVLFVLYIALALPHSILAAVVPKQVFGAMSGFSVAIGNVAGLLSPVVIGYLLDGPGSWFAVFGLGAVIALIPALVLAAVRRPTPA